MRRGEINVPGRKVVWAKSLKYVKAWWAQKNWKPEEDDYDRAIKESGLRWDQRNGQELYHMGPNSL